MNIIDVTNRDRLDALYNNSALTIEGLSEESFGDFVEWVKEYSSMKNEVVYKIKGEVMNNEYGLTGTNRYPDDLTIASIMLEDIENVSAIVIPRFEIGGRWFDDIVDNNNRREGIDEYE